MHPMMEHRMLVVGAGGVGASSLVRQFVQNNFFDDYSYFALLPPFSAQSPSKQVQQLRIPSESK